MSLQYDAMEDHIMTEAIPLIQELNVRRRDAGFFIPSNSDVRSDVLAIYQLHELQKLVRFHEQKYWEDESVNDPLIPGNLYLENVAAHSFQVASAAQLLVSHFPPLDRLKVIELALIHDQPEIIIGDKDPVGSDGKGLSTHAFNADKRNEKQEEELVASQILAGAMRQSVRKGYESLIQEFVSCQTEESRFVKAIDKLQSLIFVRIKKRGRISPQHMAFTIRYTRTGLENFPALQRHFKQVLLDILDDIRVNDPIEFPAFCKDAADALIASSGIKSGGN